MENRSEKLSDLFNTITGWTVLEILLIVFGIWLVILIVDKAVPVIAEYLPARHRVFTLNLAPMFRVIMLIVMVLWLIPIIFNVTFQNFILIAGALSVAIGFALKDLASSVIAGFVALFEKPYRGGDWVRVGEDYGEVVTVGMRAIQLRTADDNIVTVPHDRIWEDNISNANDGKGTLRCVADFYLEPAQACGRVPDLLEEVARTSPYLAYDQPVIVVSKNTSYAVKFSLKAYPFELRDQFQFITDLSERGRAALIDAGIALAVVPEFNESQSAAAPNSR